MSGEGEPTEEDVFQVRQRRRPLRSSDRSPSLPRLALRPSLRSAQPPGKATCPPSHSLCPSLRTIPRGDANTPPSLSLTLISVCLCLSAV